MRTKIDIGVHKRDSIEQVDFAFATAYSPSVVELQANSPEQIFAEKLLSLSTHGELMKMVQLVFGMNVFVRKLGNTRVNWLDVPPREVLDSLTVFLEGLK